jgi:hypothetical protein
MKKKVVIPLVATTLVVGSAAGYYMHKPSITAYAQEKTFMVSDHGKDVELSFDGLVEYELNNYLASKGIRAQDLTKEEKQEVYNKVFSVIEKNEGSVDKNLKGDLQQLITYYTNDNIATTALKDAKDSTDSFYKETNESFKEVVTKSDTDLTAVNEKISELYVNATNAKTAHDKLADDTSKGFEVATNAIKENEDAIAALKESAGKTSKDVKVLESSLNELKDEVSEFKSEYNAYTKSNDKAISDLKTAIDTRLNLDQKTSNELLDAEKQIRKDADNFEKDARESADQELRVAISEAVQDLKLSDSELQTVFNESINDTNSTIQSLRTEYDSHIKDNDKKMKEMDQRFDVLEKSYTMYQETNNGSISDILGDIRLTNSELKTLEKIVADNKAASEKADDVEKEARVAGDENEAKERKAADDKESSERTASINNEKAARESADATEKAARTASDENESKERKAADAEEKAARTASDEKESEERKAADAAEKAARTNSDENEAKERKAADAAEKSAREKAISDESKKRADEDSLIKDTIFTHTKEQESKNTSIFNKLAELVGIVNNNKAAQDSKNSEIDKTIKKNKSEQDTKNESIFDKIAALFGFKDEQTEKNKKLDEKDNELDSKIKDVDSKVTTNKSEQDTKNKALDEKDLSQDDSIKALSDQLGGNNIKVVDENTYNQMVNAGTVDENTIYFIK